MIKSNRKNIIKKLAHSLTSYYAEMPISLERIIDDEELQVFYDRYELNTFDGMTIYDKDRFFIHMNIDKGNKVDSERGRFTLAHELGHYFIDSHRIGLKNGLLEPHPSKINPAQHAEIEQEANYFASCLLMPESVFQNEIYKYKLKFQGKFSIDLIDILKDKFHVSKSACAIRFSEIGNHPIMIIYAINDEIKWNIASEDFPFKYLINRKKPSRTMVLGEYYEKQTEDSYKTISLWAVDCFSDVTKEDIQRKLSEYCITYKGHAMSILWED